jgi:hypothetical protein
LTTGITEVALTGTARAGMAYGIYDSCNGITRMFIAGGITTFAGTSTCHLFNGISSYTSTNQFLYLEHPFAAPATWQVGPALPLNASYRAKVVVNGKFYVCSGTSAFPSSALTSLYEIDVRDLGAWVSRSTMPTGRYGHQMLVIDQ